MQIRGTCRDWFGKLATFQNAGPLVRISKTIYSALLRQLKRGKKKEYKKRDRVAIKYLIDTLDITEWVEVFLDYL